MNDNVKKALIIGVAILGAGGAVFGVVNLMNQDKPVAGENVIQIPEGSRSMKDAEMEAQQGGQTLDPAGAGVGSKDELGGSITPQAAPQ
jgi:hypothetical protein